MSNTLTFSANLAIPNIRVAKIMKVLEVDEDNASMTLALLVQSTAGVIAPPLPWTLVVRNGSVVGAIAAHPAPGMITEAVFPVTLTGAGVAAAFTTTLAAYIGGGGDKRGALLTALKGISGTVTGSNTSLDGTSLPILPAGTVS
jgi:hypothetical protein